MRQRPVFVWIFNESIRIIERLKDFAYNISSSISGSFIANVIRAVLAGMRLGRLNIHGI
jgi:hypothetical protein